MLTSPVIAAQFHRRAGRCSRASEHGWCDLEMTSHLIFGQPRRARRAHQSACVERMTDRDVWPQFNLRCRARSRADRAWRVRLLTEGSLQSDNA